MFLEQVADLLGSITLLLPDYERFNRRSSQFQHRHECPILLSHIYIDLARFFLELHQMFSRVSHGMYLLRTKFSRACAFVIRSSQSLGGHFHIGLNGCGMHANRWSATGPREQWVNVAKVAQLIATSAHFTFRPSSQVGTYILK